MRWLFQRVVDRLLAKLTLLLAARFESHAEMELVETKAEMLRRADELEQDDSPEGKSLAAELRAAAARLGRGESGPAGDVLAAVEQLNGEELGRPMRCGSGRSRTRSAGARRAGEEVGESQRRQAVLRS